MKTEFLEYIELLWANRFRKETISDVEVKLKKQKKSEANKRYYDSIKNDLDYIEKRKERAKDNYLKKKKKLKQNE